MQKLLEKLKNTPTNAPQVCSSVNSSLNKDQSLSVKNKVLSNNNPDVDLPQRKEEKNLRVSSKVYVLNKRGEPLMPCSPRKAKKLLKENKANVIRRSPFTIQLKYPTGEVKQDITLGIDSGAKKIGFSAVTTKKELISGEVILDDKMKSRLYDRRMYRRNRRSRLWYRKPRFLNRVSTKKKGWFPPSIRRKYFTHLTLINKIKDILPVSKIVIEIGNFDIQKIRNPDISGKEYQEGDKLGYENTKQYILAREKYTCQLCRKSVVGKKVHLHHITSRKIGTDKPDNLALLHKKCHIKLHEKNLDHKLKKNRQYIETTFMNIIKNRFQEDIKCKLVFGYETSCKRRELGIEKSHINDAFVISGGKDQERTLPFEVIQKRKNNRSLQKNRKGFERSIRRKRYKIQPLDLVKINNKWYETKGSHNKGTRIIVSKKSINIKLIEKVIHCKSLAWRLAIPLLPEGRSLLARVG